jgi:hypothetical protein
MRLSSVSVFSHPCVAATAAFILFDASATPRTILVPHKQLSLRHAVLNRALFHIESKIVPCASLERWHEYAAPLIGCIESVLQCVSSDMRDKLDEYAIFVESAYPERRHETITCLLRSLARAYTKLPHLPLRSPFGKQVMMYTHTRRSIFEGHELELIKRWVVKTMSLEEQREYLFALKVFYDIPLPFFYAHVSPLFPRRHSPFSPLASRVHF